MLGRDFMISRIFSAKVLFFLLVLLCFQNFSCAKSAPKVSNKGNKNLPVKGLAIKTANGVPIIVKAEIASTEEERNTGFMFREKIPDGTGMLFVYKSDRVLNFWMKNTPTPLSIAYIDYKGQIKDIYDMEPYNLNGVVSSGFVRYALEVPQGWFERVGIKVGDYLVLPF